MSFISRDLLILLELLSLILNSRADSCINDVKHGESFRNSLDKFLGQVYVKLLIILALLLILLQEDDDWCTREWRYVRLQNRHM